MHVDEAVCDCGLCISIAQSLPLNELVGSRGLNEDLVAKYCSVVGEWCNPRDLHMSSDDFKCGRGRLLRSLRGLDRHFRSEWTFSVLVVASDLELIRGASSKSRLDGEQ